MFSSLIYYKQLFFGIKGFEPLNIRTKNEGLTNLAIFQKYLKCNKNTFEKNVY